MIIVRLATVLMLLVTLAGSAWTQLPVEQVAHGSELVFAFANGQGAWYSGLLHGDNVESYHGLTIDDQKVFEQYWIVFNDSILDRNSSTASITPALLQREYTKHNTSEEVFFADSLTLLTIRVKTEFIGDVKVYPALSAWWRDATESIVMGRYVLRKAGLQAIVTVSGVHGQWENTRVSDLQRFPHSAPIHMPVIFWGRCVGDFAFSIEITPANISHRVYDKRTLNTLLQNKQQRLQNVLHSIDLDCSDTTAIDAFRWIAVSLDALTLHEAPAGILTGFPPVNDQCASEALIALPGAFLSFGRFSDAAYLLRSIASLISANEVSTSSTSRSQKMYRNDADAAAWFAIMMYQYYQYTGDSVVLAELYPVLRRGIEYAVQHAKPDTHIRNNDTGTTRIARRCVDSLETGGDNAFHIQLLRMSQLRSAIQIARLLGDAESASEWASHVLPHLEKNFRSLMRGKTDIRQDEQIDWNRSFIPIHPNTLQAFSFPFFCASLIDERTKTDALLRIFGEYVNTHGIKAAANTANEVESRYGKANRKEKGNDNRDAAIRTCLTGSAIDVLCRYGVADSAWFLTRSVHRLAMNKGLLGGIPACPYNPALVNGVSHHHVCMISHAKSAAEYVRAIIQNYLGIRVRHERGAVLEFAPQLPSQLDYLHANVHTSAGTVRVSVRRLSSGVYEGRFVSLASSPILLKPPVSLQGCNESSPLFHEAFESAIIPPHGEFLLHLQPVQVQNDFIDAFRFAGGGCR